MTIDELKARKKALGYTNRMIADLAGVPFGTVQKVFSGATRAPRYETLIAIEDVLMARAYVRDKGSFKYNFPGESSSTLRVEESVLATFYRTEKKPGEYTEEDFDALPDGRYMELIEGYFYDMGQPTTIHQMIAQVVYMQLDRCVEDHGGECQVFMAPVGVKLASDDKTIVLPDVVVACGREKLKSTKNLLGAPDLCIEVLSPSNRDHDLFFKYNLYKKYGVREYWIIDPKKEVVAVYDLENSELPVSYTFADSVPVGISQGKCSVDFKKVKARIDRLRSYEE